MHRRETDAEKDFELRVSVVDKLEITDLRPTSKGYLAVRANIARSGVYQYARKEIGLKDGDPNELVGVYRSPEFVFNEDSLAKIAHKPVTINHPRDGVSASNWKKDAVGHIGAAVWEAEDRKHVQVDMLLMDAAGVNAAKTTHKEISLGYSVEVKAVDGVSPEGEPYVAEMVGVYDTDHCALVPAGRAGSTCRIGDAAWPIEDNTPPKKETRNVKTILVDSVPFNQDNLDGLEAAVKKVEDRAATAETKLADATKALTDAEVKAAADLKDATTRADTAEAKIVSLEKELADSKVTPEQLRDAAKVYASLIDAAAKIAPDFKVEDNMSEAEIRKGVVLAKFGDAYSTKGDAFFDALFEVESAKLNDAKPETDPYRAAMAARDSTVVTDARTAAVSARQEMIDRMINPLTADAK